MAAQSTMLAGFGVASAASQSFSGISLRGPARAAVVLDLTAALRVIRGGTWKFGRVQQNLLVILS